MLKAVHLMIIQKPNVLVKNVPVAIICTDQWPMIPVFHVIVTHNNAVGTTSDKNRKIE